VRKNKSTFSIFNFFYGYERKLTSAKKNIFITFGFKKLNEILNRMNQKKLVPKTSWRSSRNKDKVKALRTYRKKCAVYRQKNNL
jgi:hypothetical protein